VWVDHVLSKFSGVLQINSTRVILRSQTPLSHHLSQKKTAQSDATTAETALKFAIDWF